MLMSYLSEQGKNSRPARIDLEILAKWKMEVKSEGQQPRESSMRGPGAID